MTLRSPFEVLGVGPDATPDEVRLAWRRRAKETHPDHGGPVDAFLEVQAACRILLDPSLRARLEQDPTGLLETEVAVERRKAHHKRRRARLSKLYD